MPGDNEEMSRLGDEITELEGEYAEQGLGRHAPGGDDETEGDDSRVQGGYRGA